MRYTIEAVCAGAILFLLTSACAAAPTSPSSTEPPTLSATVTAPLPTASLTLTPTRIATVAPSETPTPVPTATMTSIPTRTNTPLPTVGDPRTAVPPTSEIDTSAQMVLQEEYHLAQYYIRQWCSEDLGSLAQCMVTIEAAGQPRIVHEVSRLDLDWLGKDLTGDGSPDVVVNTVSPFGTVGGSITLYSLDTVPVVVFKSIASRCGGEFVDLHQDGRPEFVTCDYSAAISPCAGIVLVAASVPVVLEYDVDQGYVPASYRFPDYYIDKLTETEARAAAATPGADGTTKCGVLPVVLIHLYLGEEAAAWVALEQYYPYPDIEAFQQHILETTEASPLYAKPPP